MTQLEKAKGELDKLERWNNLNRFFTRLEMLLSGLLTPKNIAEAQRLRMKCTHYARMMRKRTGRPPL